MVASSSKIAISFISTKNKDAGSGLEGVYGRQKDAKMVKAREEREMDGTCAPAMAKKLDSGSTGCSSRRSFWINMVKVKSRTASY